ncbi:MAG TPA: hypothetical protein VME23_16570 [Terracidiphilus sp.]|nr:hypothetical protein [Terracidiphilus sp.]
MEIAPIPGIRTIAPNRTPRADYDLSPAFDINALSKMGDGAAATRVKKAAGAEENDDDLVEDNQDEGEQNSAGVNYFA